MTTSVEGPAGPLEVLTVGRGAPSTVFAHGVGAAIESTRPFASGVRGARTFFHFRGHGSSVTPDLPWTYDDLADELRAVADHVGAGRALGVSMGAAAILRLLTRTPDRFERVALVLPPTLDEPRRGTAVHEVHRLARRLEEGDVSAAYELFAGDTGAGAGAGGAADAADRWARSMGDAVADGRINRLGLARALASMPGQAAVGSAADLADVTCPILVLAQEGDEVHPAQVARRIGEVLPQAQVHVLPPGGLLWAHRDEVRRLVSGFLGVTRQDVVDAGFGA
ncbi:alpha/beta hydrolase [Arsenicicoccus dermatophilus]|uniref:alpha/beta fold hydrolase n=1 Tax=Arsenicicoccus dermatophilus TaxID=1076331 RepID=UPI0038922A09